MHFDILISGAGPVGLCLARTLSGQQLRIGIVDSQPASALEQAAFDGREIALTQRSAQTLRTLGLWPRIEAMQPAAFSPLRDARVLNGSDPFAMVIGQSLTQRSELGWLVSNHLIRRAAWAEVQDAASRHGDIHIITGQPVREARTNADAAHITLADGSQHSARLLVAADSRFSATRRAVGIGASLHDWGRSMLVAQFHLEKPHQHAAWEWFGHHQTLALLPMQDDPQTGQHRASVVLTLPHQEIEQLQKASEADYSADITRRFEHRLGAMQLCSTRHAYPLVGVYPHRLITTRFACVGDAAVGMHPVTAHGFNFGLLSVDTLAQQIRTAQKAGKDIASPEHLARYERHHRLATRPLYEATRFVATLYGSEAPPARLLRGALLRVAERITPFKRAIAKSLAGT